MPSLFPPLLLCPRSGPGEKLARKGLPKDAPQGEREVRQAGAKRRGASEGAGRGAGAGPPVLRFDEGRARARIVLAGRCARAGAQRAGPGRDLEGNKGRRSDLRSR